MIRGSDEVTYLKANGLDNILAAIATKSCPRGVDYFIDGATPKQTSRRSFFLSICTLEPQRFLNIASPNKRSHTS